MNTTGKLRLFLLSLLVLVLLAAWNEGRPSNEPASSAYDKPAAAVQSAALDASGQSAAKDPQPPQAFGPVIQETEPAPLPTLPIDPPPDDNPPPGGGGGGGGMNTFVIALLIGLALVAFVGLLLWVASRGRTGP